MPIPESIEGKVPLSTLVQRAQEGDRSVWGELLERALPTVRATAWRVIGDWHRVDDIAQDVCVLAIQKIHQLQSPLAFLGWMRAIAHYHSINVLTRNSHAWPVEQRVIQNIADVRTPDLPPDIVIQKEEMEMIRGAVARLRPMDREAITGFHFDGNSLEEMRELLDVPLGTIKRRLHVARKRLREKLEHSLSVS